MRKTVLVTIVLAVMLPACGPACVVTLHPLTDGSDAVFDPSLLGGWLSEDLGTFFTAEKSGEDSYLVTVPYDLDEEEGPAESFPVIYDVRLVRLGKHLFADLSLSHLDHWIDSTRAQAEERAFHFLPTHTIHRISVDGDKLNVSYLSDEWLKAKIEAGEIEIGHVVLKHSDLVITAPTERLQALLQKHASDDEAFSDIYDIASWFRLTALQSAAVKGEIEEVRLLLKQGVGVDAKSGNGWTALLVAARYGRTTIVQVLLTNGADVNAKAEDGTTALSLAQELDHHEIVQLLKSAGAVE